ncbi:MAG: carbohydrate binding domain-containing protein [Mediterraneibacter sp.]
MERRKWKSSFRRFLRSAAAVVLAACMLPVPVQAAGSTSSDNGDGTFTNPVIYSDVPDLDVIRVEDNYYMVSTTMHLSPGMPIMKSKDLVNWEIVNYCYDILDDSDELSLRNGKEAYGDGTWAASIKYHDGKFYVSASSQTTGKTYVFSTTDIENGVWKKSVLDGYNHDLSLLFDDQDDGTHIYMFTGSGSVHVRELQEDAEGNVTYKDGGLDQTIIENANYGEDVNLAAEGAHAYKINDKYYIFMIQWPNGGKRQEICWRSDSLTEGWECKLMLDTGIEVDGQMDGAGVAQGGIVDTPDGDWYAPLFQDHGAVGRVPMLAKVTWEDDWPVFSIDPTMDMPVSGQDTKSIVVSDEFYNGEEKAPYLNTESDIAANSEAAEVSALSTQAAVTAAPTARESTELIVNGGFDDGIASWEGNEDATLEAVADDGASNNTSVKITDRTKTASGPRQDLTGKLKQGQEITVSAKVKYTDGPDSKTFNLCVQNGDWQGIDVAASATVTKGDWTTIEGTYTIPSDADMSYSCVFIESAYNGSPDETNDLFDFYADDISVLAETTEVQNPNEIIVNGGFENGTDGWELRTFNKPANMKVTSDDKASGESSLFVYDKEDTTSGPMQNLTGKVQQGQKLHISAKVKYETGPDTRAFNVTMQYGTNNFAGTSPAASATLTKGEWGTIEADYTVPSDADLSRVLVFVETTWTSEQDPDNDLMDFYLDDVSIIAEEYVDPDEIIINGGFENGTEKWKTKDPGTITAVTEEHASGNTSAKITDRTATASGPMQDITGKIQQGQLVQVSAKVKYKDGPDNKTFNICIQNGDWKGIEVAASANVKKGEWTTIEGKFTIPNDADMSSSSIFIETAYSASPDKENDLFDFYVDDISLKKLANPDTVQAGENDYNGSNLKLEWQWNHNPNNKFWSLTERDGYLRLTTANKATGLLDARNTLTQRTYGPTCSGDIAIETANMKNGDVAGLAALQANYGYVGVKMENGQKSIVMVNADGGEAQEIENIPIDQDRVYLRADFNFYRHADDADFYYSLDGTTWNKIGNTLNMSYTIPHFMGYRFAIFNYATQATGGYVDVDYFHVNDGADTEQTNLNVNMADVQDVQGIINTELEVPLYIDGLPEGTADRMEASINIPSIFDVADVEFNGENVSGTSSWTFANHQLKLSVTGEDTGYADNSGDRLFATLKLKLNNYVAENTTVTLRVDYVTAEGANAAFSVGNATANVSIVKTENNAVAKLLGNSNPLIDYDYGADPFALVYDGRVYLYMTADKLQYDTNGNVIDNDYSYINKLHVISSDDMVNWTDHGFIQVAGPDGVAKWANYSWAPAVAYKQIDGVDKFFLYFCNSGGGIGVLEGDSPVGPWKDPNGKALIDGSTPGVQGVPWIFDPAVMVDDDGTGYLAFGGGVPAGQDLNPKSARIVKLGDDMISLAADEDGTPQMIDAPCMFEDGGIHKANGKYYYTYCSNFSGNHSAVEGYPGYGIICYMVSDDPMGPYTYGGEILQNPSYYFNVGGNNHHALFEFNGTTYITYHAQTLGKALGIEKGYRSTHINEVEYYEDGSIKPIDADMKGVSQLKAFSPYSEVAGTTIGWNSGIAPRDLGGNNMVLSSINNGDWVAIGGVDFGENGAETFEAEIAGLAGGTIELRLDSPDGEVVGTLDVKSGNGDEFTTLSCSVENAVGEHTLFFVYSGEGEDELMEVQSWQFTEKEPQQDVDKTKLKAAIDRATAINASEYTTASLTKMYEALETAKEVYKNDKADQTAVNDAAKALNDACDALVRVSDKSVLQNLIAKVNGLKESDYTAETWNALQEALKAAVAVDAEHDATQEDVDSAAEALKAAIEALEPATGEDPDKPGTDPGEDPDKPGTTPGEDPNKPGTGSGDSGKQDGDKAVQTGDTLSTGRIAGIVIVMVLAAGTGGAVLYKRVRKNRK